MNKYIIPIPFLLGVNPVLSLVYSSLVLYYKKIDVSFYISFSIALILIYFPLMYDMSNLFYFVIHNKTKFDIQLSDYWNYNLYTFLPIYFGKKYNIDFYYFVLAYTFSSLYLFSKIIYHGSSNCFSSKKYLPILLLFLTFNYRDLMDLSRNFLSYSIFIYYIVCKNRNSLSYLIALPLSVSIHISALILWILYLSTHLVPSNRRLLLFLLLSAIGIGFNLPKIMEISFVQKLIQSIPGSIGEQITHYIYHSQFSAQLQGMGPMLKKALNSMIIIALYLYLLYNSNKKNTLNKFILTLSLIALLFIQYITIFERLNLALTFLTAHAVLYNKKHNLLKTIIISFMVVRTLVLYLLIYFPIFLGFHQSVIPNSNFLIETELKPFYYPTIFLLNLDHGYSDFHIKQQSIWGKHRKLSDL